MFVRGHDPHSTCMYILKIHEKQCTLYLENEYSDLFGGSSNIIKKPFPSMDMYFLPEPPKIHNN